MKLIKLIQLQYPKDYKGKRIDLTTTQQVRYEFIKYIEKERVFWQEHLNDKRSIDFPPNHRHREKLISIFAKLSKPQTTLETKSSKLPGEELMESFINFENRAFEGWLKELNWEITEKRIS